jgi:hypothetical protein
MAWDYWWVTDPSGDMTDAFNTNESNAIKSIGPGQVAYLNCPATKTVDDVSKELLINTRYGVWIGFAPSPDGSNDATARFGIIQRIGAGDILALQPELQGDEDDFTKGIQFVSRGPMLIRMGGENSKDGRFVATGLWNQF